jgi:hypothetical protein
MQSNSTLSDNQFTTIEDAVIYSNKLKQNWGNLVSWIEEKDGYFFVWFNVFN